MTTYYTSVTVERAGLNVIATGFLYNGAKPVTFIPV